MLTSCENNYPMCPRKTCFLSLAYAALHRVSAMLRGKSKSAIHVPPSWLLLLTTTSKMWMPLCRASMRVLNLLPRQTPLSRLASNLTSLPRAMATSRLTWLILLRAKRIFTPSIVLRRNPIWQWHNNMWRNPISFGMRASSFGAPPRLSMLSAYMLPKYRTSSRIYSLTTILLRKKQRLRSSFLCVKTSQ